ncbi:MAG TPA: hypothetical protein PKE29_08650 [Phycisphaerales bacterium]|nr:hypothetical protein [Phycisphaerales bacterium]
MNTTTTKTTTNGTTTQGTTAQSCCQGATDAFKTGMDMNQKMVAMFTETMTKGMNMNPVVQPFMGMTGTMPAAFEKMTKAMNSMVDSGARCMTECNTLMIDAMRNNARMIERTGDVMMGQMTGKSTRPVVETAREIMDEAMAFSTKAGERMTKMNTEHAQRVSMIMDETMVCPTACKA